VLPEPSFGLAYKLIGKLIKTQVSVFAFGAENAGKTSFVRRLEGRSSLRDIFGASRSYGSVPQLVRVNPNPAQQDLSVRVLFIDIGGDREFSTIRKSELRAVRPLGILFFLDHRTVEERNGDNTQIDDGTIDQNRIKRHHEAFEELTKILYDYPEVQKVCNALVIAVNKYDVWREKTRLEDFHDEFKSDIEELMKVGRIRQIPPLMPCSIKTGEGMADIMRTLFRLAGWELRLPFGKRIRFKTKLME
jgi:GTPase SAR1 family protein